ncbi:hypothetical protein HHL22_17015 [Hymenobacter sp. RP-2-7]|uniref:Uncharacterized protein n=1 Tax=Hymenobacter polaris TaxID=2682546 RepID=A0A7Y0AGK8_9BACT|nr:hypothetical protein [Hymenobacter polaris]NML66909.1 hypothetical protein [Hymenobacter polaris]
MSTPSSIEENEIILGTGMGPLRFGTSMDEVRTLVGEPEEIDESEDDDEFEHQAWNYYEDDHLLSLYFDREDDFRLSCIETDNPSLRLFGEPIQGRPLDEIRSLMERNGQGTAELETMEGGEMRLSYEKAMIDLYFEEGKLQFVNFGVFINDDLEVQWPK